MSELFREILPRLQLLESSEATIFMSVAQAIECVNNHSRLV